MVSHQSTGKLKIAIDVCYNERETLLPTKCKNEFHFLFKPVYNPSFQEKGIESISTVKLNVEKLDEITAEFVNIKEMFHELKEREAELFHE